MLNELGYNTSGRNFVGWKVYRDYDNKWAGSASKLLKEAIDYSEDYGIDKIGDWIEDKIPEFGILKTCLERSQIHRFNCTVNSQSN